MGRGGPWQFGWGEQGLRDKSIRNEECNSVADKNQQSSCDSSKNRHAPRSAPQSSRK
jgi:hypothetical protein